MAHWDLESQAGREWVRGRIQLARRYFNASRKSMAQVKNLRCRLAGIAYMARFEWMLRVIERDDPAAISYRREKSEIAPGWAGSSHRRCSLQSDQTESTYPAVDDSTGSSEPKTCQ
jgi:hypothetical protein